MAEKKPAKRRSGSRASARTEARKPGAGKKAKTVKQAGRAQGAAKRTGKPGKAPGSAAQISGGQSEETSGRPGAVAQAGLTQLGVAAGIAASPAAAVLETAPNPHPDVVYAARFVCPEFTSLCPVTGQPDFAHLVIDYAPAKWLVESKSLKLFLASFRNHGAFHEDCTVMIAKRIKAAAKPRWLRIGGYWYPRGGIPIDVFYQTGAPPKGLWLPEQGAPAYRGRG